MLSTMKGTNYMKDFQDFVDSLDQDFIDTIQEDTSYTLNQKAPVMNKLITESFTVAMRILERYHEWLHDNEQ